MNKSKIVFDLKKFLFVSIGAYIGDLAWQVSKEGHEVKYFIKDKDQQNLADGFVTKVTDWKEHIDWADIIVFDDTCGFGFFAQALRKKGKLVVGGTTYTDRLEDDREFGQLELKKHGVKILPFHEFSSCESAIEYINSHPAKYVVKPSGRLSNISIKRMLYVGQMEDGSDVIRILNSYSKRKKNKLTDLQLQQKISGVEYAIGGFFNGNKFIPPFHHSFEHKKLFPGELGVTTGEMGTSMFWKESNSLSEATIERFTNMLREEKFVGYFDINCIVTLKNIYPLEFTCRFGYPTIMIQQDTFKTPTGEFLYKLAKGENFKLKTKKGFHVGVRVVVPPYPYQDKMAFETLSKGNLVIFKNQLSAGVHIEDVRKDGDDWVVSGTQGTVLVVVGSGSSMKLAQKQAYSRVKNIIIPHMYYRNDIGSRWQFDHPRLKKWGYL